MGAATGGADTLHKLAVLSADVCGSTRLYEEFGDALARRDIALCLSVLGDVAAGHGGRVVETVGDEVLCVFPAPHAAALAARDMHEALRAAGVADRFATGPLRVKIAWHYALAHWRAGQLVGAAPLVVRQVSRLARPEETLASGAGVDALPEALRAGARYLDTLVCEVDERPLPVFRLPWEEEDEEVTRFRVPAQRESAAGRQRLVLRHGGREHLVEAAHPRCSIGRTEDNDIVTGSSFSSRHHADIVLRHGRFCITDVSVNGTLVIPGDGRRSYLRHEEGLLHGEGVIVCGNAAGDDAATIHYCCT